MTELELLERALERKVPGSPEYKLIDIEIKIIKNDKNYKQANRDDRS